MKLLQYIFEMLVCSGVFLAVYGILPKKARHFGRLRAFILACVFISVTAPLVEIPVYPPGTVLGTLPLYTYGSKPYEDHAAPGTLYGELVGTTAEGAREAYDTAAEDIMRKRMWNGYALPATVYLLVVSVLGTAVCVRLHRIWKLRRQSEVTEADIGGMRFRIAQSQDTQSPFSFLRTVYIGCGMDEIEKEMIIAHELSHIRHRHSQERLLMSAMRTLFWFNPFFWIFGKKLEEVQEFEADNDVLSEGYDTRLYRLTIFKQLFGYYPEISCGLKNSITKRRFIMMTNENRIRFAALRWAVAVTLVSGTVFFSSATAARNEENTVLADETRPQGAQNAADTLFIDVTDKGKSISLNGNVTAGIAALFGELSAVKADIVMIRAEKDVPMGTISDIKLLLRKSNNLTVIYGTVDDGSASSEDVIEITGVNRDMLINVQANRRDKTGMTEETGCNAEFAGTIAERIRNRPEAIISLRVDRETSYGTYRHILEQIDKAYAMVRNSYALEKFGKTLDLLDEDELRIVRTDIPRRVAEAEPHMTVPTAK